MMLEPVSVWPTVAGPLLIIAVPEDDETTKSVPVYDISKEEFCHFSLVNGFEASQMYSFNRQLQQRGE